MRTARRVRTILLAGCLVASAFGAPAAMADEPSPERVRSAAEEFDMGRRAFIANDFEQAAIHFENAYHDAPRAEALRNAIRARRAAKQPARAATLASLAAVQYSSDTHTMAFANETLAALSPQLFGVTLACEPECGVEADGRVVSLGDAKQIAFYLAPGKHELVVLWSGDRTRRFTVSGAAGSVQDLDATAPPPAISAQASSLGRTAPIAASRNARKPFGPVVFIAGAALTAGGIAAVVLSGIDAQNDPGVDAVRRDCVGQGESCPTYQRGKSAELRTNVLLGATAGVGIATAVIGLFFTQWSRSASSASRVVPIAPIAPYVGSSGMGIVGQF